MSTNHVLLLGAGFSFNWGGWLASEVFDYLLGCPEIENNASLKELLIRHNSAGGFEDALAELQLAYTRGDAGSKPLLDAMEAAVIRMFRDLNKGLTDRPDFEFQNDIKMLVRTFLAKFDAIFTLNQDLLLEKYYLNDNIMLSDPSRWNGFQIPGMKAIPDPSAWSRTPADFKYAPEPSEFKIGPRLQPYFKLHGSSNWQVDSSGRPLLVIGGNKSYTIQSHHVLKWYFDEFRQHLARPNTRLMVIGFGFKDEHIRHAISEASNGGSLKMYIIDPRGIDIVNKTAGKAVRLPDPLEQIVMGVSRRSLNETFGTNLVEHNKVMKFFQT